MAFVEVFTREGARHNGPLCEPVRVRLRVPALLCISRRYVQHRHTPNRRSQPHVLSIKLRGVDMAYEQVHHVVAVSQHSPNRNTADNAPLGHE